ncbi:MAG: DUF177 domain-containing protein [Caldimonas sp.]
MVSRAFDPLRLDVERFAVEEAALEGSWPLSELDRLSASSAFDDRSSDSDRVSWAAKGEQRTSRGSEGECWLHLEAVAKVVLQCQRCLGPVPTRLDIRQALRFVHGEDAAAQLDSESDDDVLAMTRALDLRELVEDELLLSLPLVPMHDTCPEPLIALNEDVADRPNPFAALAALKDVQRDD